MTSDVLIQAFKKLDDLGVDATLQAELREVIEEISSNANVALDHIDEWDSTADFISTIRERFVEELGEAYPIFSVLDDTMKMSFVSRNDGKYWQFTVSKSAFLEIREVLKPSAVSSEA